MTQWQTGVGRAWRKAQEGLAQEELELQASLDKGVDNEKFRFDASRWVLGDVTAPGEWSVEDRVFIGRLRGSYPELQGWGDAALGFAWGSFSQDVFLLSWANWVADRYPAFLAYLYVMQMRPSFEFGACGGYDSPLEELAGRTPWMLSGDHTPAWANC